MKLDFKKISILFLSLFVLVSCNKDDDNEGTEPGNDTEQSDAKSITSFTFLAADNDALSEDFEGSINEDAKTITLVVPNGTDISALIPTIVISEEATVDPDDKKATDFGETVTYTVTAEDDSEAKYTVIVSVGESSSKMVTAFVFLAADNNTLSEDVEATIDEGAKTITAEVPFGTDITALVPTITISEAATITPNDKQATDFSEAVVYTVTAEDSSTVQYEFTIVKGDSSLKQIESFVMFAIDNIDLSSGVAGAIDEENRTILVQVPAGTSVESLVPTIRVSEGATVNPESKTATDFTGAVTYTVTAEDGSATSYTVTVKKLVSVDRPALVSLYNANPGNTLGWDLSDTDISNWEGVTLEDGRVSELIISSSNIKVVPKEIGSLENLEILYLFNNSLTSIPVEIGNLSNLQQLYLFRNSLTGIPAEVGNLSSLKELYLYENALTSIPVEIGNLSNLTRLYLNENTLTSIPAEVGNLSNLTFLILYDNDLSSIPAEIGNLSNLTHLYIYGNTIATISGAICNLGLDDFRKDQETVCQ